MSSFIIEGGNSLYGDIYPQGAKNEALQVIAATLLTNEKIVIDNIPNISDVNKLIAIVKGLGADVQKISENVYSFQTKNINLDYLNSIEFINNTNKLRGSILIVGPLLARCGYCIMPKPGGDKIGRRKLDIHFDGLVKLGAKFEYNDEYFKLYAKELKGNYILLEEASVTGTANIIMAAVLAEGITTIYNAACEPYIQQLCRMLIRMGAKISGIGSNLLTIQGVSSLNGCEHKILPDMIEVGSFIGLAAITRSKIRIKNVNIHDLGLIPQVFKRMGINIVFENGDLLIPVNQSYEIETYVDGSIMTIADATWPGFSPDLLSIALVVATQANGSVLIHQKMFESRLFFIDKLIDMGAKIILCDPHRATVIGLNHTVQLKGIEMTSPDIRAGVALLIAALSAKGKSIIHNIEQIDRGYENIDIRLKKLGANITRIN